MAKKSKIPPPEDSQRVGVGKTRLGRGESRATEKSSEYASRDVGEAGRVEELQEFHQPVVEACARAAVRSTLALRQVFLVRAKLAVALSATARSVGVVVGAVARGEFLPGSELFDVSESVLELGLADTRAARSVLGLLTGQVRALHEAVEAYRAADPVATFRSLRATSRGLLTDPDEGVRSAWRYVLLAWGQFSTESPKVAAWQPGLGEREEVKLSFDEATGTWKSEGGDSEAAAEVKATYAVAK
jgi:hypothetical protein